MMIPHPSVETLLAAHGTDAAGRRAARARLADAIRRAAEEFAALAERSDTCNLGRHQRPGLPGWGCQNSGATCICECHDPEETRTDA